MALLLRAFFVALAVLAGAGCVRRAHPTGTVTGKVTYKGKPVPSGCLVTFVSDRGIVAMGTVDASGSYRLMTAGKPEVPALEYNVAVTFPGAVGPEMTEEDERKYMAGDPETMAKFSRKGQLAPIPAKYADEFNSGLAYAIKEGANTFDIDLQ